MRAPLQIKRIPRVLSENASRSLPEFAILHFPGMATILANTNLRSDGLGLIRSMALFPEKIRHSQSTNSRRGPCRIIHMTTKTYTFFRGLLPFLHHLDIYIFASAIWTLHAQPLQSINISLPRTGRTCQEKTP